MRSQNSKSQSKKRGPFGGGFVHNDEWAFSGKSACVNCNLNVNFTKGEPEYSYSLYLDDANRESYSFAYNKSIGLCFVDHSGKILDDFNVIGDFMKLALCNDEKSAKEILTFIRKYGFFFKLPEQNEVIVKHVELCSVLNKYKNVLSLYSALTEEAPDYSHILEQVSNTIIDSADHTIIIGDSSINATYVHAFAKFMNADDIETIIEPRYDARKASYIVDNGDKKEYHYDIYDTFLDKKMICTYDPPKPAMITDDGERNEMSFDLSCIYGRIEYLYYALNNNCPSLRNAVDLYYHILFTESNNSGRPVIFTDREFMNNLAEYIDSQKINNDKAAIQLLKKVVCNTIADEINHALMDTHITFSAENLYSSVYVKDLFTAMYMALAAFDPRTQIYRECGRESCKRLFLDKKANEKTAYCCKKCAGAEYTKKFREKKKNSSKSADSAETPTE